MQKVWIVLLISFGTMPAFAAPGNLCFENVDDLCGIRSSNPAEVFGAIKAPLNSQFDGLFMMVFWGGIMGIIWFKTENIMLLGIVGIIVSVTITGLSSTAQGIGMLLLAVSIGILIFQLIRQRISVIS